MSTVNCFGIHSDEVGLRYLVQENVTNAYGFSRQEPFDVETPFSHKKCPHKFKITTGGTGLSHKAALAASPIRVKQKGYVADPDEDINLLAAFGAAHVIPAWMLNAHTLKARLFTSNISTLIVPNCTIANAELINEIQTGIDSFYGKVIFHGDFYFSSKLDRLPKLPDGLTVKEAKKLGLDNMSNYLRGKDA